MEVRSAKSSPAHAGRQNGTGNEQQLARSPSLMADDAGIFNFWEEGRLLHHGRILLRRTCVVFGTVRHRRSSGTTYTREQTILRCLA